MRGRTSWQVIIKFSYNERKTKLLQTRVSLTIGGKNGILVENYNFLQIQLMSGMHKSTHIYFLTHSVERYHQQSS